MKLTIAFLMLSFLVTRVSAAWYWPFESDEKKLPRMSELMEESSILIDEAFDLAAQNKISEAVEKYKQAYTALERLEHEHPERAATSEFSTVRNKKAYVSTAIDSLLLKQASENARAIVVTDTTEIERKYAAEQKSAAQGGSVAENESVADVDSGKTASGGLKPIENGSSDRNSKPKPEVSGEKRRKLAEITSKNPANRKARIMLAVEDLKLKEYDAAELTIKELLAEKPNDATALNLKAALEAARNDYEKAKSTLHQLIQSNPKEYSGYYNLAKLIIRFEGATGKPKAKRYYDTAREYYGGPKDERIERMLK